MSETPPDKLQEYRAQIDALDEALIDVLAQRYAVVRAVGALKKQHGLDVVQGARAEEVKRVRAEMGAAKGLDPAFVRKLYEMMIDHAHVLEHGIVGREGESEG